MRSRGSVGPFLGTGAGKGFEAGLVSGKLAGGDHKG
jgi:hypothetical protein